METTNTGPPGQKEPPSAGHRGRGNQREILTRTLAVHQRRVKQLEALRRRFWQGDTSARRHIETILLDTLRENSFNPMTTTEFPLQAAKERLSIPDLWQLLNLSSKPGRSCRAPFRQDRNPSFSIYDGGHRWKEHGTGLGGDADFRAAACNLSKAEGARKLIELAGTGYKATPDLDSDGG